MPFQYHNEIIQAFSEGRVVGVVEPGEKPQRITTWISDVFLYPTSVYKIYQTESEGFNRDFRDLSNPETREWFYGEDFACDRYFNPEVYQELLGVRWENGEARIVSREEEWHDLVIKMKRIDTGHNLTRQLKAGKVDATAAHRIGYEMTRLIAEFPHKPEQDTTFHQLMHHRLDDVTNFCYLADSHISRSGTDGIVAVLRRYLEDHRDEFVWMQSEHMVIGVDNQSDNVFYGDEKVSFIDLYQQKDNWLLADPLLNAVRLSADVRVLGSAELANSLLAGYKAYYNLSELDDQRVLFYQLYAALIKLGLCVLYKEEGSDAYREFIESNLSLLN